jgi:hypothetical protein
MAALASPAENAVQVDNGRVSLCLTDSPFKTALDTFFKNSGKCYVLTPMADQQAKALTVTLRIDDAGFQKALDALMNASSLRYTLDDNIYTIMTEPEYMQKHGFGPMGGPIGPGPMQGGYGGYPQAAARGPEPVYVRLQAMPVEEAYEAVIKASHAAQDPLKWEFEGDLGKTIMPGADFASVPVEMAARIVIATAGLTPPMGPDDYMITKKGQVEFSQLVTPEWFIGMGGYSVANYRAKDGQWRFFILASSQPIPELVKLLIGDRSSYVIEDRSKATPAPKDTRSGVVLVSVRLIDVTLDEALTTILEPTGFTFKKRGKLYIVQQTNAPANSSAKKK